MNKLTILLVSITFLTISKANAQVNTSVSGRWTVDWVHSFEGMDTLHKEKFANMSLQKQAVIKQAFDGRTFYFYSDSLIQIKFTVAGSVKQVHGKYYYDPATGKLTVYTDSKISIYRLEWITPDRVILVLGANSANALFHSLYLVRNN